MTTGRGGAGIAYSRRMNIFGLDLDLQVGFRCMRRLHKMQPFRQSRFVNGLRVLSDTSTPSPEFCNKRGDIGSEERC